MNFGHVEYGTTRVDLPCSFTINNYLVLASDKGGHTGCTHGTPVKTVSYFTCHSDVFTTSYYPSDLWTTSDWIAIGY